MGRFRPLSLLSGAPIWKGTLQYLQAKSGFLREKLTLEATFISLEIYSLFLFHSFIMKYSPFDSGVGTSLYLFINLFSLKSKSLPNPTDPIPRSPEQLMIVCEAGSLLELCVSTKSVTGDANLAFQFD
jgi:hypothetical protein